MSDEQLQNGLGPAGVTPPVVEAVERGPTPRSPVIVVRMWPTNLLLGAILLVLLYMASSQFLTVRTRTDGVAKSVELITALEKKANQSIYSKESSDSRFSQDHRVRESILTAILTLPISLSLTDLQVDVFNAAEVGDKLEDMSF